MTEQTMMQLRCFWWRYQ